MTITLNIMPRNKRNMENPHSWINYPNLGTRRCTRCGCIKKVHGTNKGVTNITYERNGVIHDSYIPCIEEKDY